MNGAAVSPARALVRANPQRLTASWPRAVVRRRLLSAAAVLTRVANARLRRRAFLSEHAALAAQLCASTLCTRARGGRRYSQYRATE